MYAIMVHDEIIRGMFHSTDPVGISRALRIVIVLRSALVSLIHSYTPELNIFQFSFHHS